MTIWKFLGQYAIHIFFLKSPIVKLRTNRNGAQIERAKKKSAEVKINVSITIVGHGATVSVRDTPQNCELLFFFSKKKKFGSNRFPFRKCAQFRSVWNEWWCFTYLQWGNFNDDDSVLKNITRYWTILQKQKHLNRGPSRLFTWVSLEFNAWRGRNSIRLPRWSTFDWRDVRRSYTFMLNFCRWMLISTCTAKKMYIFSIAVCARVLSTSYTWEQYALHYNWIQRFLFFWFFFSNDRTVHNSFIHEWAYRMK